MPDVVAAIGASTVARSTSAREYRPSFDEVFAILVERDRGQRASAKAADGADRPGRPHDRARRSPSLIRLLAFIGKELAEVSAGRARS